MHDEVKARLRREIPAVSKVLDALGDYDLPRPLIVDVSGENFQKFVRRRRLRNSDRSSILCAARSRGFAPAGYNRLSTGPELSFTRTLGGRHSLPKRFVRSARSVRRTRILNTMS